MTFRRFVEFETSISDDTVDDSSGWKVGGRNVALALGEILHSQGLQVGSPDFEGDHGWTFPVRSTRSKFHFQVQHSGKATVLTDDVTIPSLFGKRNPDEHIALLTRLNEALSADPRFSKIRWCAEDEVFTDSPGAPTPLG
jgi:hypothetical protein